MRTKFPAYLDPKERYIYRYIYMHVRRRRKQSGGGSGLKLI